MILHWILRILGNNMDKAFYRVSEVAEIVGLGRSLTYRLVAEGHIPSVWLAGCRSRRVSAAALRKWIEEQEAGATRIGMATNEDRDASVASRNR